MGGPVAAAAICPAVRVVVSRMRTLFLVTTSCLAIAHVAAADAPVANFLGQKTFATAADCPKLKRVAQAGVLAKAAEPLPKTLSAKGYVGPDGTCTFTNVVERYADRVWTVSMVCNSGSAPAGDQRTQVWRKQPDGSLTITELRDAATWLACVPDKPAAPSTSKAK
jgi:hypothetical protein